MTLIEEMDTKEKIVHVAADLLAQGGREAVSTRAVAAAAGVQAPTIYRHFGDMRALMDAVAIYGFEGYMREKTSREPTDDPVETLRQGWDLHVAFGLSHPAFYALMYGDTRSETRSSAADEGYKVLHTHLLRVAEAGRLRVGVERAAQMIHAGGCGVTFTLLELDPNERDLSLSAQTREVILGAITLPKDSAEASAKTALGSRAATHAVALKAVLDEVTALSSGEKILLSEWLDRLSQTDH